MEVWQAFEGQSKKRACHAMRDEHICCETCHSPAGSQRGWQRAQTLAAEPRRQRPVVPQPPALTGLPQLCLPITLVPSHARVRSHSAAD